ncbi:dihydrofolate reductase family protein [[Enterobacter] lignolyticus]|uniref:Deaminase n=1 Tax=[Enterobacter] lignolyticus TaxID=1334193 RepID=A0A806XJ79_9ENTR|nr:dihydrofolate reductase family protein [[Enterobacter] lignolyticus]ALR78749.1 deaminase [[Enterobacter] lignolyticus]
MITTHVFIAVSLDGFIARQDGDIRWLLQRDDPGEDHGYDDFIIDKEVIVMGRGSYEKVMTFDTWPYDLPVLVLSKQLAGTPVPDALKDKVQFIDSAPGETIARLAEQNIQRVYLDGGQVVQSFLREGLITDMVITTVPVLIGSGKPLFGTLSRDIDLTLLSSRSFPSGLVQSTYHVNTNKPASTAS